MQLAISKGKMGTKNKSNDFELRPAKKARRCRDDDSEQGSLSLFVPEQSPENLAEARIKKEYMAKLAQSKNEYKEKLAHIESDYKSKLVTRESQLQGEILKLRLQVENKRTRTGIALERTQDQYAEAEKEGRMLETRIGDLAKQVKAGEHGKTALQDKVKGLESRIKRLEDRNKILQRQVIDQKKTQAPSGFVNKLMKG
ncbi:hypothetical protein K491DRAFT_722999 [Lophiostoma macrostomum CBS 122681]|uniref:Uncharacterized protein n=1 Tax=Lophiostoma macrostomum CBS 122681 TaxID=1314788 RepID=A0A6A6SNK1_9PLEO|nr:hypothetical protein K491DRAFT_722999 [Lophiostoma macrostomum CBS 122681]